ncbi:hypothetical protein BGZ95_004714 [Linnemannia exigua]|uniref:Polysaccharide lyase 14 domain-containing protein n=1 Tax=Linnemannia exigua TaxID=604196 RepID=A0AAD4D2P8_9FUNG|nr:hypothetical protein BGZ95_004714 [Linnemannia exigua]
MKFNVLLLQVALALTTYAPSTSFAAKPTSTGVTISGVNQDYSWSLPDMPSTLQKLSKPLALAKPLVPGQGDFDIVLESSLGGKKGNNKSKGKGKGKGKGKNNIVLTKRGSPNRLSFSADGDVSLRAAASNDDEDETNSDDEESNSPADDAEASAPEDAQAAAPQDGSASPFASSERVLRSLYPAGSYARSKDKHASFVSTPLPPAAFGGPKSRYIRLEYQMMFQPGFKWVKGGKLPGILMGSEQGCNESCFSTRMMWRANGMGELYLYAAKSVYFPDQKPEKCKRSLDKRSPEALFELEKRWINAARLPEIPKELALNGGACLNGMGVKISPGSTNECNPTYGISVGRGGKFQFKSGQWHNVTQVVRVNSKGKAVRDGYLAVYLDGTPVVQADKLVLLKNGYDPAKGGDSRQVKFMFSSFFGGHTKDYATPSKQWIAWKDFAMATNMNNVWEH